MLPCAVPAAEEVDAAAEGHSRGVVQSDGHLSDLGRGVAGADPNYRRGGLVDRRQSASEHNGPVCHRRSSSVLHG